MCIDHRRVWVVLGVAVQVLAVVAAAPLAWAGSPTLTGEWTVVVDNVGNTCDPNDPCDIYPSVLIDERTDGTVCIAPFSTLFDDDEATFENLDDCPIGAIEGFLAGFVDRSDPGNPAFRIDIRALATIDFPPVSGEITYAGSLPIDPDFNRFGTSDPEPRCGGNGTDVDFSFPAGKCGGDVRIMARRNDIVPTATPTPTPTDGPTRTPIPTSTASPIPTATATSSPSPVDTATVAVNPSATPTASPPPRPSATPRPPAPCVGDCNDSGDVTVDEVVRLVNIALGGGLESCLAGDATGDGQVTVDEIVAAIVAALEGCVRLPSPTPTSTSASVPPSHTPTATSTPTVAASASATPTATSGVATVVRLYVSTNDGVSVVDVASGQLITTIPTGGRLFGITASPDGRRVFAGYPAEDRIEVIDTVTNRREAPIPAPRVSGGIVISADGSRGYASAPNVSEDGTIVVFDPLTGAVVSSSLETGSGFFGRIALDSTGTLLYAANDLSSTVSVLSLVREERVRTVPVGAGEIPGNVAVLSSGRAIVTSSSGVFGISPPPELALESIWTGGNSTFGLRLSRDGTLAYVTDIFDDDLRVIDVATGVVVAGPIAVGEVPVDVALSLDETVAYVTSEVSDAIHVVDLNARRSVATIDVGSGSRSLTIVEVPVAGEVP